MPTNRTQLNANVVNGKIYLIAGRTGGQKSTVALNEVYDIASNSWTTKKSIPYPVVGYASAVLNGKIYVIGGQDEFHSDLNLDFTQIYDPETDTWSFGASLPTVVLDAAAGATTGVAAPKRIYVFGGTPDGFAGTNITQVYDPENDTWTFGVSMPTARGWLAVAVVNDMLYAIGGSPGFMLPFITENEQYTPIGHRAIKPVVSVLSPENKTYNVSSVPLTFTVSEPGSWIGYSLDEQANVTITGNTTLTGLSDGIHSLTVYASDLFGNIGSSSKVYFTIDTPPRISILSPENKTYDTTDIPLNFTVNETASWIAYSLDSQANVTIAGNTTLSELSYGSHSLIVYAKDVAGNTGASETIYFTIAQQSVVSDGFFPTLIVAEIAIVAVVGATLLVYFAKVKKTTEKAENNS